jgi:hypothetical protein
MILRLVVPITPPAVGFSECWDRQYASFDRLRMRVFLGATKTAPHPELVEGRKMIMQRKDARIGVFAGVTPRGRDDESGTAKAG